MIRSPIFILPFSCEGPAAACSVPSYTSCPPDSPLLPRPTNLTESNYVQDAAKNLSAMLDAAVQDEIKSGWIDNVKPFWEYHHRGENNEQGVTEIDDDTQYLIGSVSKVFSDLMLLKSGVDLQARVTDFLPQLRDPKSKIRWEDITLEMLADHLAGISPNAFYEFYFNSFHESLALPQLNDSEYPRCGVLGLNSGCTRERILLYKDQVVPINSRPVYSQLSFTIYTLCLEAHTGKNYSQILQETIYKPLNLLTSGLKSRRGGLYSTTNDLSTFLSAILNHSILPTPAAVRKWLKPLSTTSLNILVGRPWEILRITDLIPHHAHTVDIYSKSGGAIGYMAMIAVIEQYGIGVSVLSAGPVDAMNILYRAVLGTFVPAIEEEGRFQSRRLAGTWTSRSSPNSTHTQRIVGNERIKLTLDLDDGLGLKLTSLTSGNASITDAIKTKWEAEYLTLGFGILPDTFRLYPTNLEIPVPPSKASSLLTMSHHSNHSYNQLHHARTCEEKDGKIVRQEWRINLDIILLNGAAMSDLPGQTTATQYCGSWQTVDWMTYGGVSWIRLCLCLKGGLRFPG
ncbi:beta-lactamase/transpeptidase-like protein [Aspergillus cavernicola]|uniref:Beta-lactamase/transpeptidase-like protein n=1 Tax=Aspergillus cavernicola TaxID=176166 RepID=A0ABR4I1W7_9EURO